MPNTILDEIIANKEIEVEESKQRIPQADLVAFCESCEPPLDFYAALAQMPGPNIIAECKRQSPSRGVIKENYNPITQALAYEAGGAAAISVLTDSVYFGGALSDLQKVTRSVGIPVIRKDFIVDEYQIYEARRHGASSFLLLAGVLDAAKLQYLIEVGRELAMEPLVEIHNDTEMEIALRTDAKIVGINNRNLKTMQVDFDHALQAAGEILKRDHQRILVCESGVTQHDQIAKARTAGMNAFLIGEHLMRSDDPEKALLALRGAK